MKYPYPLKFLLCLRQLLLLLLQQFLQVGDFIRLGLDLFGEDLHLQLEIVPLVLYLAELLILFPRLMKKKKFHNLYALKLFITNIKEK